MEPLKRVALIGSAPSSIQLGPYDDPSWQIWGCSPGAAPLCKRVSRWFELHRREPGAPWFAKEYMSWMRSLDCLRDGHLYVSEPWPEMPDAVVYDKDKALEEFGPYFFTSTVAWMFAEAILSGAEEIGLWGVDMAAKEEWEFQRSGCHYFIWEAHKRGINVILPPESDLWMPPPLYGFQEVNPHWIKLMMRKRELDQRIAECDRVMIEKEQERQFLRGARDDNEYHIKTWVSDRKAIDMAVRGPSRESVVRYIAAMTGKIETVEEPPEVLPEAFVVPEPEIMPPTRPKRGKRPRANGSALIAGE